MVASLSPSFTSSAVGLATRPAAPTLEEFEREVLVLATEEQCGDAGGPRAARICEDAQTRLRYGADGVLGLLLELKRWCLAAKSGEVELGAGQATELMDKLLASAAANLCVYWMAPAAIPTTRPVVVVRRSTLAAIGRRAVLKAIWEHERAAAAGQGGDEERGSLYDPLHRSFDDEPEAPQG
ncbi:hypothetical protein QRD43_21320 [Pelomonas sp. APW6]|uniref:Uncharacterized protein n=1 Tax=Roseateles subflavus TaxID=3053353 RepID=A0ABT7LNR1_9BURK|nr:hypothetical protein [Pelomonas sp. APW6]MDL5034458.1 hypothetical protein [Pelomonas sp. APW6]